MNTIISPTAAPRRNLVLAICCMSLLMVSMDATIVNVALPSIRVDLSASLTQLQWVIDAYTVVLARFLMLGGANADRFGRRRVFQIGMALFTFGPLLGRSEERRGGNRCVSTVRRWGVPVHKK